MPRWVHEQVSFTCESTKHAMDALFEHNHLQKFSLMVLAMRGPHPAPCTRGNGAAEHPTAPLFQGEAAPSMQPTSQSGQRYMPCVGEEGPREELGGWGFCWALLTWGICFGSLKHWQTPKDLNSLGTFDQAAFMLPLTLSKLKIVQILALWLALWLALSLP